MIWTIYQKKTTVIEKHNLAPIKFTYMFIFNLRNDFVTYYSDVIMSAMASRITGILIVNWIVCLHADQRKYQNSASWAFMWGNSPVTGEFPPQRASNAEKCFQLMTSWWYMCAFFRHRCCFGRESQDTSRFAMTFSKITSGYKRTRWLVKTLVELVDLWDMWQ